MDVLPPEVVQVDQRARRLQHDISACSSAPSVGWSLSDPLVGVEAVGGLSAVSGFDLELDSVDEVPLLSVLLEVCCLEDFPDAEEPVAESSGNHDEL